MLSLQSTIMELLFCFFTDEETTDVLLQNKLATFLTETRRKYRQV